MLIKIPRMFLVASVSLLVLGLAVPTTFAQQLKLDLKLEDLKTEIDLPHGEGGESAPEKIGGFIVAIINLLLGFSAIIAVGAIIWGGVQITTSMTSGSGEHKIETGKKTILYAIIGLLITGFSFLIISLIRDALLK